MWTYSMLFFWWVLFVRLFVLVGFFGHASWHAEVPGPGIEAMPQQQPSPLQ